jgi:L-glyceraldehyde 3-phosphate reductase
MAIAWVLSEGKVTTALIGASKPEQVKDCVGAINNLNFNSSELSSIDKIAKDQDINLWAQSSESI